MNVFLLLTCMSFRSLCAGFVQSEPTWLESAYFRANSEAVISSYTGSNKTPTYTFTFTSNLSGIPTIAYGIKGYEGNDFLGQQYWQIRMTEVTQSTFSVLVQIYGITNLNILNVAYIAGQSMFPHHLNGFDNIPINYTSGILVNISSKMNQMTTFTELINYTKQAQAKPFNSFNGQLSSNKILLFMTSLFISAQFKSGSTLFPVKIQVDYRIINASHYTLTAECYHRMSITRLHFSQIIFNQKDVQSSLKYYLVYQLWTADKTGGFKQVPIQFVQNFIMGLRDFKTVDGSCGIQYIWQFKNLSGIHGVQLQPSEISYGACGLNQMRSTIFYIQTWQCDPPYNFFNLTSRKCQDTCGDYYFQQINVENGQNIYQCPSCFYACKSCASNASTDCLECATTDFREKTGNSCLCKSEYMDNQKDAKCLKCTDYLQYCEKCFYNSSFNPNDYNTGALEYGCLVCDSQVFLNQYICQDYVLCDKSANLFPNYTINKCISCAIPNCKLCESFDDCKQCQDVYFLNFTTKQCQNCVIIGCSKCSSQTQCLECRNNFGYFLNQSTSSCIDCGSKCIECDVVKDSCTKCQANFIIEGKRCQCQNDSFFLNHSSGICEKCHPICKTCSSQSQTKCKSCYSQHHRILHIGLCLCDPYNYIESASNSLICGIVDPKNCDPYYRYSESLQECVDICGDGYLISVQCDDGNLADGDGCSHDCNVQKDFSCTNSSFQKSVCQYTGEISFQGIIVTKKQTSNTLKLSLEIVPNYLPFYRQFRLQRDLYVGGANMSVDTANLNIDNGEIQAQVTYYEQIIGKDLFIGLKAVLQEVQIPASRLLGERLLQTVIQVQKTYFKVEHTANNLYVGFYDEKVYSDIQHIKVVVLVGTITILAVGLISVFMSSSLPLIQIVITMQTAFVCLATISDMLPLLLPLTQINYINGYNQFLFWIPQTALNNQFLQYSSIGLLSFQISFVRDFNVMLVIQIVAILLLLFVYLLHIKNDRFKKVYRFIQKTLLILVLFNINNTAFNTVLLFFAQQSHSLEIVLAVFACLFLAIKTIHICVQYKNYATFGSIFQIHQVKFKTYFIPFVLSKLLIAVFASALMNNLFLSRILVTVFQGLFFMAIIILRPFKRFIVNICVIGSEFTLLLFLGCIILLQQGSNYWGKNSYINVSICYGMTALFFIIPIIGAISAVYSGYVCYDESCAKQEEGKIRISSDQIPKFSRRGQSIQASKVKIFLENLEEDNGEAVEFQSSYNGDPYSQQ